MRLLLLSTLSEDKKSLVFLFNPLNQNISSEKKEKLVQLYEYRCVSSFLLHHLGNCPAQSLRSLLAPVVGSHDQVAVRAELFNGGGPAAAADGGRLSLHPRELQHAAGVVFEQVALEGLPAAAHAHHHVLVVQHLQITESPLSL